MSYRVPATKVTTYTNDGSWTKDARAVIVEFFLWGGGGGGGSGRCGAAGTAGGGSGGTPGTITYLKCLGPALNASPYTITIGQGGTGGALVNATTTNGNPGNPGGTTSVGSIIRAGGGNGGSGGNTGTSTTTNVTGANLFATFVQTGTSGSNAIASAGTNLTWGPCTGGGGGSGYSTGSPRVGGAAQSIMDSAANILVAGGLGGANTGATAGNGNSPSGVASLVVGGTGGGGGGNDGNVTAGSGGDGAAPGGGGGGGAGNVNLSNSGAGGNGARGQVLIIEYF